MCSNHPGGKAVIRALGYNCFVFRDVKECFVLRTPFKYGEPRSDKNGRKGPSHKASVKVFRQGFPYKSWLYAEMGQGLTPPDL